MSGCWPTTGMTSTCSGKEHKPWGLGRNNSTSSSMSSKSWNSCRSTNFDWKHNGRKPVWLQLLGDENCTHIQGAAGADGWLEWSHSTLFHPCWKLEGGGHWASGKIGTQTRCRIWWKEPGKEAVEADTIRHPSTSSVPGRCTCYWRPRK